MTSPFRPSDRVLRQYLAGALEPPAQTRVLHAIAADPGVRERLALLQASSVTSEASDSALGREPPAWALPPPGAFAPHVLRGTALAGAVMATGTVPWVTLRFAVPDGHETSVVVVLERDEADWSVIFPLDADECVTAGSLPTDGDQTRLDVTGAGDKPRLAVVLCDPPPDFTQDDPFSALRDALARGALPAATFRLDG